MSFDAGGGRVGEEPRLEYLPLDKIDISLSNVRKANPEEGIEELAKSIKEIGLQQPVVVYEKKDGRFELIIGQRRYLACKKLGWSKIPAIITTVKDETDAIIKSFSENIHRLDLGYQDKMQVAAELLSKLGSIKKVAEHLGVSPQTVRNYLGYAGVPEPIKKMVEEKKLSATTAVQIAKSIPEEEKAIKIAEKIQEIPRSDRKAVLINVARDNPEKPIEEIVDIAKKSKKKITINITERIYNAVVKASETYDSKKEDIVTEALEEWLDKRGFFK